MSYTINNSSSSTDANNTRNNTYSSQDKTVSQTNTTTQSNSQQSNSSQQTTSPNTYVIEQSHNPFSSQQSNAVLTNSSNWMKNATTEQVAQYRQHLEQFSSNMYSNMVINNDQQPTYEFGSNDYSRGISPQYVASSDFQNVVDQFQQYRNVLSDIQAANQTFNDVSSAISSENYSSAFQISGDALSKYGYADAGRTLRGIGTTIEGAVNVERAVGLFNSAEQAIASEGGLDALGSVVSESLGTFLGEGTASGVVSALGAEGIVGSALAETAILGGIVAGGEILAGIGLIGFAGYEAAKFAGVDTSGVEQFAGKEVADVIHSATSFFEGLGFP